MDARVPYVKWFEIVQRALRDQVSIASVSISGDSTSLDHQIQRNVISSQ